MSMDKWAEEEVELAKKKNNDEYYTLCLDSALKAYKCLMEDGHSGMSFSITRGILKRLMDEKPLTPITDDDFFNYDVPIEEPDEYLENRGLKSDMQCSRKSSLFREETLDGKVSYHDIDRVSLCVINNGNSMWHNGYIRKLVDEMYPITMPYDADEHYTVYAYEYLFDPKQGDFDTWVLLYLKDAKGNEVRLDRYFTADKETGEMKEITLEEFEKMKEEKPEVFGDWEKE